ncbi:hypothetical protein D9758_009752 [Tetrapyrgos nigripes]|uniref:Uncharacterized protein n=1 Tax=Tetrapyrgos nigripes TaxID=182062 RepID=A0A8H5GK06_9AGAR|nr:hypothetical protein D9758_009752 [Tetrapyrgos nigripes]
MVLGYGIAVVRSGLYFWLTVIFPCVIQTAWALNFSLPDGPTPTVTVGEQATATWIVDSDSSSEKFGFFLLLNCDTSDDNPDLGRSSLVVPQGKTQGEFSRNVTQAGTCHFAGYQQDSNETFLVGESDPLLAVSSLQAQPPPPAPAQSRTRTTVQAFPTNSSPNTPTPSSISSPGKLIPSSISSEFTPSIARQASPTISSHSTPTLESTSSEFTHSIVRDTPANSTTSSQLSETTPPSPSPTSSLIPSSSHHPNTTVIGGTVGGAVFLVLVILVLISIRRRRYHHRDSLRPGSTITPFLETSQRLNRAGLGNPSPTFWELAHRKRKFKTSKAPIRDTTVPEVYVDSGWRMSTARAQGDNGEAELRSYGVLSVPHPPCYTET